MKELFITDLDAVCDVFNGWMCFIEATDASRYKQSRLLQVSLISPLGLPIIKPCILAHFYSLPSSVCQEGFSGRLRTRPTGVQLAVLALKYPPRALPVTHHISCSPFIVDPPVVAARSRRLHRKPVPWRARPPMILPATTLSRISPSGPTVIT